MSFIVEIMLFSKVKKSKTAWLRSTQDVARIPERLRIVFKCFTVSPQHFSNFKSKAGKVRSRALEIILYVNSMAYLCIYEYPIDVERI